MGEAAIDEDAYYREKHLEIIKTREYTEKRLKELGFEVTKSSANFLFAKHPEISGQELYLKLKQAGILIRQWNKPRIADYIRITIGTKVHTDALISAIKKILP
jgi:histidinol-phosphate aminotransferase